MRPARQKKRDRCGFGPLAWRTDNQDTRRHLERKSGRCCSAYPRPGQRLRAIRISLPGITRGKRPRVRCPRRGLRYQRNPRPSIPRWYRASNPWTLQPHRAHCVYLIKYKQRNRIERFFNKLKQFRRIATRYEKHAFTFLAMIHIVSAFISAQN